MTKITHTHRAVLLAGAIGLSLLAAAHVQAAEFKAGTLTIADPWARASPGAAGNGGAFMTIHSGGEADRLLAATADVSRSVELHTHVKDGDVMRMRPVESIDVPAGGAAELAPGGLHVMLIGLKAPLREGASFPLTLRFEKAGPVAVDVVVGKTGAMSSPQH